MQNLAPIYHGPKPVEYLGYTIGLERLEDILTEVKFLHSQHWNETQGYLSAPLDPDYDQMIAMERNYNLVLFIVRAPDGTVAGNLCYHLGYSLHQKGKLIASEDALFITKAHRKGRICIKLLEYAERILTTIGVHYITIGDKSPAGSVSIGRMVTKMGYKPVSNNYLKELEV